MPHHRAGGLRRRTLSGLLGLALATSAIACAPLRAPQAAPPPGPVAALGADEILRRAEAIRNPDGARASEVEIVTVLPDARAGARQASYSIAALGAAESLALRQSADEMRGALLLFRGDRTWLLQPGPGTNNAYEFHGAQARLGDWVVLRVISLDLRSGWQARLAGEERYGDEPCYKLELTSSSTHLPWSRLLYWIGTSDFRPRRLEGYAASGFLVSMVRYEGFADSPLGPLARRIVVEGGTPQEEIHTASFTDVRPLSCDPSNFTLEGLSAVKDAARSQGVMAKNATRVRIEDLLQDTQRP